MKVPRRRPQTGAPFDRLPHELYELRVELDKRLINSIPESVTYETVVASAERERAQLAKLKSIFLYVCHPWLVNAHPHEGRCPRRNRCVYVGS